MLFSVELQEEEIRVITKTVFCKFGGSKGFSNNSMAIKDEWTLFWASFYLINPSFV